MKKIIKKLAILSCLFSSLFVVSNNALAGDGWSGSGGDTSFGGGGDGTGCTGENPDYRIDCSGVSWLKYNYVGGSGEYLFVPNGTNESGWDGGWSIGGKCAKSGVGFYHLGINIRANRSFSDGYAYYGNINYNGKDNYWNSISNTALNDGTTGKSSDPSYTYTYRINGEGNWGHRYSLTIANAGGYYTNNYVSGGTYSHLLYKNGSLMYKSASSTTSKENIVKAYEAFLNNMYSDGTGASASEKENCSYSSSSWTCSSMPTDIYAFCAFPIDDPTKLSPKATITISGHPKSPKSTSYNFSATKSSDTAEDTYVHEVSSSTISVQGDFNFKIDKSIKSTSFKPSLVVAGQDVSAKSLSFSGTTEIGDGLNATTKTKTVTLSENVDTELCVSAESPDTISTTSSSGKRTATACLHVKYVPITATIDSDTRASLDGKNYDSGADASKTYPDANNYITVKAGPKTVTWSHYLGWTSRSDEKTGNVLAKTYGLNGAKTLDYALTVGKYNNSHTFNLNKNDDGYPSTSGNNNTSEAGVFPGEARDDISQSLKHPSKVNVTSGDAATDSSDESSSVTLRLKADNIQCGLDNDHLYPIGVDAPNDYRWLSIHRDNIAARPAASATAGDGVADSDNLWITEDNKIYISQIACFGSQIGVDAGNKGSDRFSRNLWANSTVDNREPDTVHNRQFALTSDFSDTYFMANSASGVSSHTNRSLRASEIGVTNFSNVSTPKSRITNNYKIEAKTGWTPVNGYLGRSFNTTFRKPGSNGGTNGAAVTVSVKIPYNYYLTVNPGGSETLDGASNASFAVTIKNNGRVNKQVCSGRNNGSNCAAYATRTKKTTANMVVFALDSNFDVNALSNHSDFTMQGNMTSVDNIKSVIGQRLGSYNPQSLKEAPNGFSNTVIGDSGTKTLKAEDIDYSDYPVGTKICAATAVYPSDSHDTGISTGENAYVIDSAEQSNALRENGQLTRYNVTCRTVAKHQTMSVEGNGLATAGNINTNSTVYKGRVFRSWSEYQIVSSSSNAGSGAVTAYALNNAVTDAYATKDNIDQYSVKSGSFLYPQSLGNIRQLTYLGSNSKDEATTNWGYAEKLKNTIIDKYGNPSDALPDEYYRSYSGGNIEITPQGYGKETIIIRTTGKAAITANSKLDDSNAWGNPKQIIIIANSIDIAGDVEKVNAWLIVDGGEFNTCAGNQPDYKKPGTNEGDGNQHLLDNCNRPLFINGAVIVDGPVTLPRTYGGGSVVDAGGSITKDERTYALRAEIFNYDPRVVKWAYEESKKNPQLVTTYTESLAPRL